LTTEWTMAASAASWREFSSAPECQMSLCPSRSSPISLVRSRMRSTSPSTKAPLCIAAMVRAESLSTSLALRSISSRILSFSSRYRSSSFPMSPRFSMAPRWARGHIRLARGPQRNLFERLPPSLGRAGTRAHPANAAGGPLLIGAEVALDRGMHDIGGR